MVNHVGVHVLRPSVGNNIYPDRDTIPGDSESDIKPEPETRKTRKRKTLPGDIREGNESAPQELSQLNGADPQGSVGGDVA